MKCDLVEYLVGGTSQPGNKINFLGNKYLKGRPVVFNGSSNIERVSCEFISLLQDSIPQIIPSHKNKNMGLILDGSL